MAKGVSAKPALFTVSPLTDEQTLQFFKTRTPAPDQVVEWMKTFDPFSIRERWQGVYVISSSTATPSRSISPGSRATERRDPVGSAVRAGT
ncbi:hypothetical protein ACWEH1_29935 [Micromonospora chersina]